MIKNLFTELRATVVMLGLLTLITGVAYPLAVTGIARTVFPEQASGSLLKKDGKILGSTLIGQPFDDPKYFFGRPSATGPVADTAFNGDKGTGSTGSNLGPLNPALQDAVKGRIKALHDAAVAAGVPAEGPVPVDLVTTSASGLDPDISPAAAQYQVARVAAVRGLPLDRVRALVDEHIQGRQWGIFGEPRVNVLELNLALDELNHPASGHE